MSQLLLSIFSSKILCSDGCHAMVSNNKSNIKTIYLRKNLKKYSYVGKNVDDCQLPDVLIQLVLLNKQVFCTKKYDDLYTLNQ